jgi:hypothetical protein
MENTFGIGTLVVDDRGSLILLLQDGIQTGEFKNGVLPRYYEGVILPNMGRWRGLIVRPVGHISDLVKILSQTVDINTPATKGTEDLSDKELLARALTETAELKKKLEQFMAAKQ